MLFQKDNPQSQRSLKIMVKKHELHFELLNVFVNDFYLFADFEKVQRFRTSDGMIAETVPYFAAKDKSF